MKFADILTILDATKELQRLRAELATVTDERDHWRRVVVMRAAESEMTALEAQARAATAELTRKVDELAQLRNLYLAVLVARDEATDERDRLRKALEYLLEVGCCAGYGVEEAQAVLRDLRSKEPT